ncbi:MAG: hypothetical protein KAW45_04525 [Thermoplasmatales archaeon]|nr:hypothetical protein [Thermoplasmatales archaeon]
MHHIVFKCSEKGGFAQIIAFAQKIQILHKKSVFLGNFCAKPEKGSVENMVVEFGLLIFGW